ncbi:MAG TPA: endolytic transglycosylase MltG [candidate division Zixibacteria bacterium]|nr:endolytic transglycosylase MltG [candidate division Zixibacteria bacterium]
MRQFLFLVAGLVLILLISALYVVFAPVHWEGPKKVVEVRQGEGARVVAARLKEAGVIKSAAAFRRLARLTGTDKKIKVGAYSFLSGISLYQVVEHMASPKAGVVTLFVPEGATVKKIGGLVQSSLGVDSALFVAYCKSREFVRSKGVGAASLEGYLFPSSYEFYWKVPPEEIIAKMFDGFEATWKEVTAGIPQPETLNVEKIVTMASLIEAETGVDSERVLVAQVFYRRLKLGYPLQCDPTVIYAMGETRRLLSREDLKYKSPYNTYVNRGLPPGPICNVGKEALAAALAPASTKYLYFVANGDGGHIFSETLDQHNRAVYRLRKANR